MAKGGLHDRIERIVLKQTNVFIRELLRSKGLRIGATKEDFEASLKGAIDSGKLTGDDLDKWIDRVEGWGNQHIYPFAVTPAIGAAAALRTETAAKKLMERNGLGAKWDAPHSQLFPVKTKLTRISWDSEESAVMFEWHVRAPGWVRDPKKDIPASEIDGDIYRFDAFRRQPGRIVTRFVLRAPGGGGRAMAALMVRKGVRTSDHAATIGQVWTDLGAIDVSGTPLSALRDEAWGLSSLIKKLDSAIVRKKLARYQVRATKLTHQSAAVEFTNTARGPLPTPVMNVRLAIPPATLRHKFDASGGEFGLDPDPGRPTSRWTRIQFYPADNRIKLGSELDREDVWNILDTLEGLR